MKKSKFRCIGDILVDSKILKATIRETRLHSACLLLNLCHLDKLDLFMFY